MIEKRSAEKTIPVNNGSTAGDYTQTDPDMNVSSAMGSPWLPSLKHLVPRLLLSIFISESIVMLLLSALPPQTTFIEALVDSTVLLIVLSPTFYYLFYRPVRLQYEARKKAIAQLGYSKERLSLTLEVFNDGFFDWNLKSGESYFSPRAYLIFGYQPGEFPPDMARWQQLIHPAEQAEVEAKMADHIAGRSSHFTTEHRLQTKTGSWLWVLTRAQVVARDDCGCALRLVGTVADISARKKTEEALRTSEAEIHCLAQQLLSNSEDEKKQLAQDLHDDFGQVLTAFQLGVEMLRSHSYVNEQDYQSQCARLLKIVARLEIDLRHICDHLRPLMLEHVGLTETLRWHINEFMQLDDSLQVDFKISGDELRLSRPIEIVCYRILQESLNNVVKHSDARRVDVSLEYQTDGVSFRIADNGRGIGNKNRLGPEHKSSGYGLLGMRERAKAVGGKLTIDSVAGQGTSIHLLIPLERDVHGCH